MQFMPSYHANQLLLSWFHSPKKHFLKEKAMNRKKGLIVYYSRSGSTRLLAEALAEKLDADLFELETKQTYPDAQNEIDAIVTQELESGTLPELKALPENLSAYDLVLVGGPVWMYTVATPVMEFLSRTDFGGLRLVPFCTHQGGLGRYFTHFREQAGNAQVLEGIDFYAPSRNLSASVRKLDEWANTLFAA